MFKHYILTFSMVLPIALTCMEAIAVSEPDDVYATGMESSNDIALKAKVHAALHSEPRLVTAPEIIVDAGKGVVVLKGIVKNDEHALRVCNIVQQIDGIKEVQDNLFRANIKDVTSY